MSARRNDLLNAAYYSINEHHFDTVGMGGRLCEQFLNDTFGQLPCSLILFLHNSNLQTGPDVGSYFAIHETGRISILANSPSKKLCAPFKTIVSLDSSVSFMEYSGFVKYG